MLRFSSDPQKAASNLRKHGVTFGEAQTLPEQVVVGELRHADDGVQGDAADGEQGDGVVWGARVHHDLL